MGEVIWLGLLFGCGAAVSVGPIFVTILHEAVTRGFGASLKVILGSAFADLILLIPALAFTWFIMSLADAQLWVAIVGALVFTFLALTALRDARRLWNQKEAAEHPGGWAFWKGVVGNLVNPLTWTFWLATGTPTMLRAQTVAGNLGLVTFTVVWFVTASGLEAVIAFAVASSGRRIGTRGQSLLTVTSGVLFLGLAGMMVVRNVLPVLTA
ncbi:LysE family translocator [Streptomyces sp. NPDC001165]|uniref:LysE family translocator n=1 Tax=Streptomyces sp. NPDC001165 TaxID=3364546 RepID=UPI0036852646